MTKKRVVKSKVVTKRVSKKKVDQNLEMQKILIENFVSLQKVMTNLSFKFDDLTLQISELLKLFEDSAKVIVKNELSEKKENRGEKQLLDTMLSILDQNKVIAKGLTLMYEHMTDVPEKVPENHSIVPESFPKNQLTVEEGESSSSSKVPAPEEPPEFPSLK